MAIYIVQHGKCFSKTEDPAKGLTPEGRRETARIADVARGYAVKVGAILHRRKKRTLETAEIGAARLDPEKGIQSRSGMNPMDDVSAFAGQLPLNQNIMLVGHLPFLERLVSLLVCGDADRVVFKLQNSGIVCIDEDARSGAPAIHWALMPHIGQ